MRSMKLMLWWSTMHDSTFGTIQHRMLEHGLGKLPAVKVILYSHIARKYLKLRSNKLDSITKYFKLSNKMEKRRYLFGLTLKLGIRLQWSAWKLITLKTCLLLLVVIFCNLNYLLCRFPFFSCQVKIFAKQAFYQHLQLCYKLLLTDFLRFIIMSDKSNFYNFLVWAVSWNYFY